MERHYGMDWLRIGAFGLLIVYHIGMFFVPWDWHVKTADPIEWTRVPMLATNAWRLALLFAVSGFASAAVLGKQPGPGRFLASRSARLLVPLVFAAAVIIPPQPWVELTFKHGYTHSFAHFWANDYFRFGTLDGIVLPTWQHLWFVVYLWVYTAVLALLLAVIPARVRQAIASAADRAFSGVLVIGLPLALLWFETWASWPGAEETHALVDDFGAHRIYFALFLFGFFLADAPRTWAAIRRWWRLAAVLSVAGYALVAAIQGYWLSGMAPPFDLRPAFEAARAVQGWCAIVALVGLADRYWNRDHRLRPMLTEAVFPFYIVHQTIIVVTGWYLLPLALPAGAEFVILLAATVTGCWLFYRLGRETALLRPLIGLRLARRDRSARETGEPQGAA